MTSTEAIITGAAITAVAGALGAGSSVWVQLYVRKQSARTSRADELRDAVRDYLTAVDSLVYELQDHPVTKLTALDRAGIRAVRRAKVDQAADLFALPFAGFLVARGVRRIFLGARSSELIDRVIASSNRLRLIAPVEIVDLMRELTDALEPYLTEERSLERLDPIRRHVRAGMRLAVDLEATPGRRAKRKLIRAAESTAPVASEHPR